MGFKVPFWNKQIATGFFKYWVNIRSPSFRQFNVFVWNGIFFPFINLFLQFSPTSNNWDLLIGESIGKIKSFVDIFTSYTSPLIDKKIFVFENGLLEQNYKEIIVKGPAINLDKKKFFKKPKVLKVIKCNNKSDAIYSLKKSVDYFLNIIINRKSFPKNEVKLALLSNKYIL